MTLLRCGVSPVVIDLDPIEDGIERGPIGTCQSEYLPGRGSIAPTLLRTRLPATCGSGLAGRRGCVRPANWWCVVARHDDSFLSFSLAVFSFISSSQSSAADKMVKRSLCGGTHLCTPFTREHGLLKGLHEIRIALLVEEHLILRDSLLFLSLALALNQVLHAFNGDHLKEGRQMRFYHSCSHEEDARQ